MTLQRRLPLKVGDRVTVPMMFRHGVVVFTDGAFYPVATSPRTKQEPATVLIVLDPNKGRTTLDNDVVYARQDGSGFHSPTTPIEYSDYVYHADDPVLQVAKDLKEIGYKVVKA